MEKSLFPGSLTSEIACLPPPQRNVHERFRRAGEYAAGVMADPSARAPYEEAVKGRCTSLRNLIMSDFLRLPSIDEIDLSRCSAQTGGCIMIHAADDFKVVRVEVAISTVLSVPIEGDPATRSETEAGFWTYHARTEFASGIHSRVDVTATDRPGNVTTRTEII